MKPQYSSGFSSLSIVIALGLSTAVIAGLVYLLGVCLRADVKFHSLASDTYISLRVFHALQRVISGLDSHRFEIYPVIHKNGIIGLIDQSPNSVMSGTATLRPKPDSDAITALKLNHVDALRISECRSSGMELTIKSCYSVAATSHSSSYKSYVGVGNSGFFEFAFLKKAGGNCPTLELQAVESMSLKSPQHEQLCLIHKLIPIEELYTLYVDNLGQLRYLSHVGPNNIENQPIIGGLDRLSLATKPAISNSLLQLDTSILTKSGRQRNYSFINHLGRLPIFTYLLNP